MSPSKAADRRNKEIARQARNAARPRGAGAERAARLRREHRRRQRTQRSLLAGVITVAVVIAAIGIGNLFLDRTLSSQDDNTTSNASLASVLTFTNTAGHVTTPVQYAQTPPAGGEHSPVWLNCGVYSESVPNENAVHGMEHGAVWVTYQPDLPAADIATLTAAAAGQSFEIVSPYDDLPAPVVVSSWNKQLTLPGADDPRLAAFITENKLSEDAPEPGAPCTGGTGTPST